MSITDYAVHEDFKRPWRRDVSFKVPTYCPYPIGTKQSVDCLEPVFITHTHSLPSLAPVRRVTAPLSSKSLSSSQFLSDVPDLLDEAAFTQPNEVILSPPVPLPLSFECITLKDLKFEKLIGTGMYSKVYLVQSLLSEDYFALKVMPKATMKKTRSETDIMYSIHHPNIVKLWNSFEDKDNVYMLMEFAAGGELFYHLRERGKFEEETARFYSSEVIMALEHLHNGGIVFRDLKLENLVLSATGHLKLTDFGFAKNLNDGRTFTLCGTPEYLAPEIIRGTGYNYAVDWWALGVLLFEMLSGYSPFYSSSPLEIYKNILSGRIKFPSGMSPAAKDLLKGLLTRDPRRRLGTVCNGISELRHHPFFLGIQWSHSSTPPIVPALSHKGDTTYFKLDEDEDGAGSANEDSINFPGF